MCHQIVLALALMVGGDGTGAAVQGYPQHEQAPMPCVLTAHETDHTSPFAATTLGDRATGSPAASSESLHAGRGDRMLLAPPISLPESASSLVNQPAR